MYVANTVHFQERNEKERSLSKREVPVDVCFI